MSERAWFESHALRLGKLIGNLQMLESLARMAIVNRNVDAQVALRRIVEARAGDLVELNAFTSADGLRETLETYNSQVQSECAVDVDPVITLRDALAHGRTFGVGRSLDAW